MTKIGQLERITQNRVVRLFQEKLGYRYLGNWEDREGNSNVEEGILQQWLSTRGANGKGYSSNLIARALYELAKAAGDQSKKPYYVNRDVYTLLRYGVTVQPEIGQNRETVWLIDWKNPQNNDFAIAEEVTVSLAPTMLAERSRSQRVQSQHHKKRPDIVIYVNGIALGVIELKRSTVSITEGIRQNLDNQKHLFIGPFFTTMQLIMAGNDLEGLAYGAIETKEKYYLKWKEVSPQLNPNDPYLLHHTASVRQAADSVEHLLDKHIIQLLNKERFLELIHDFVVFDRGQKKLCRHNQYFGVKAAREHIRRREGGIIWHTQGSGKSLTMVWLTRWIREFNHNARVLVITDRAELDEQIEKVYKGVDEEIYRAKSGKDLIEKLNSNSPWLICSLVHKFGGKDEINEKDVADYLSELKRNLPSDFSAKGDIYIFVDECHRTQSGKLHLGMKTLLPDALFIGFTGTPLLKKDKQTSLEVFGKYIHTYKFDEAVADKVVLDLRYEARDIEQKITSMDKIDLWFDAKTKGLTDLAKAELKQRWGTMKKVFSSIDRLQKIVSDVMIDMATKERLQNGRGNAMLVSESVYNACRYYELFRSAGLKHCAVITSYSPYHGDIKGEETGEGITEKLLKYDVYRKMIADYFNITEEEAQTKTEEFEKDVKRKFVDEPVQMKLLIVVDKLLTGFDAPPATYLYIDKSMRDHGLFQAICRVNRLDGEDKEYGYIVDYKDLFKSLDKSIKDYTSEAFDAYEKEDVAGLLQDRLKKARERLDEALEEARAMIEPVEPPKEQLQFQRYFVGDPEIAAELKETEPRRVALYKAVIKLIRAFANIADEMEEAGYHENTASRIREEVKYFENLRKEVQIASGDYVELKQYEPAMRHLIDAYLGAEESRVLSKFDDLSLVELIVLKGKDALDDLPEKTRRNREAMAETIENNLRRVIIEETPTNPAYYEKMSTLLDELIKLRKERAEAYEQYLNEVVKLTKKVAKPDQTTYPQNINTSARRALYDNLQQNETLAAELDDAIKYTRKDAWRDNKFKKKEVRLIIEEVLRTNGIVTPDEVERIFEIVKNQQEY